MRHTDTNKMYALFNFIVAYKKQHDGNSPTFVQMQAGCGFSSKDTVDRYLRALEKDNAITASGTRGICVNGGSWRMR